MNVLFENFLKDVYVNCVNEITPTVPVVTACNDFHNCVNFFRRLISGDEREGAEACTNHLGPGVRKGPIMLHTFWLFLKYYYLSISQIKPLRPNPRSFATDSQSFRFSVFFLAGPTLL